jgi:hypothetical protein
MENSKCGHAHATITGLTCELPAGHARPYHCGDKENDARGANWGNASLRSYRWDNDGKTITKKAAVTA